MEHRPRILVLGPAPPAAAGWLSAVEAVAAPDPVAAAALLAAGAIDAVVADPLAVAHLLADRDRDELVLSAMHNGVAILAPDGTVTWAHPVFRTWCSAEPVGQHLLDALEGQPGEPDPLAPARAGRPANFRVHRPSDPVRTYLDVTVRPAHGPDGAVRQMVALARNITQQVEQQRKLDALHQAGNELAGLDAGQLAEMTVPDRVELLRQNLRRVIHDLLQYDTIEVRLLDKRTGELKPLLEEGMSPQARDRVLFARPTGNGVTGFVASTGESYLCPDTARDPLYLAGAEGARSSMTVPLKFHDEVIGTLNVESPRVNGFGADDLQFTELFSKEMAAALHTLDLLTAQKSSTAVHSVGAIDREIALPVDAILGSAAVLLDKLSGDDETAAHLRRILDAGRAVKENVRKVGRDLAIECGALLDGTMPLAGTRVLVVDPDARVRQLAHQQLTRLGAGVETAGTAGEGVALLAGAPFDAVLLDIKPPDMGGYEAYRRLRAARPEARVAMTTGFGYDTAHSIVKARADGMQHVLFKPFRQEQLVKAVLDGAPQPAANGMPA